MMIDNLRVENFKCIRSTEIHPGGFNVLIGKNDSGKSSLLGAITYLSKALRVPLSDPCFQGPDSAAELTKRGSDEPRIRINVRLRGLGSLNSFLPRYELLLGEAQGLPTYCVGERLFLGENQVIQPDGSITIGTTHQAVPGLKEHPGRNTILPQFLRYGLFSEFLKPVVETLSGVALLELNPRLMAQPSFLDGMEDPTLRPDGANLAAVLAELALTQRSAFDLIQDVVRSTIPSVKEILLPTAPVQARIKLVGEVEPRLAEVTGHIVRFRLHDGSDIPAKAASQGLLLFLGFATAVFGARHARILLVEEPENGIHPYALKQVIQLLRKLQQGIGGLAPIQVFLTTHSPYLLDLTTPEEVFVMMLDQGGDARAYPLASAPHTQERVRELLLGELWYELGEKKLLGGP